MKKKSSSIFCFLFPFLLIVACTGGNGHKSVDEDYQPVAPTFNTDSAYAYVAQQCSYGPRVMNTAAHDSCGLWIAETFRRLGLDVTEQQTVMQRYDGLSLNVRNIIASYQPQHPQRILIAAHWDSRPWADNDDNTDLHHTPISGANDGASGVAVLLELARMMQSQAPSIGVDLICFDAEDCGTPQWDDDGRSHEHTWCLGSQHWSQQHHVEGYQARYGILLDMVGGQNSHFCKEGFSMRYAPSIVDRVWNLAHRLGYGSYFSHETGGYVTDDHLSVNRSGIPCIDIIANDKETGGFCATWHTHLDDLPHIDRNTLRAVGQTVAETIYTERSE